MAAATGGSSWTWETRAVRGLVLGWHTMEGDGGSVNKFWAKWKMVYEK